MEEGGRCRARTRSPETRTRVRAIVATRSWALAVRPLLQRPAPAHLNPLTPLTIESLLLA